MNNQELKAKLIEQAKEILPKGFGISVRIGACSVFTVTIKSPYAFAHLDKLEPVNSWLQRNYLKQVEKVREINQNLTAGDGWYDEADQRWVSFTYLHLYLKPSKKAIENAEYKVAEYTWNENELAYNVVCK